MVEQLLVKIAKQLQKHSISYMLIGGQAVLLYGLPRLTEDIDITLGIDIDRLKDMRKICRLISLQIPREIDESFVKKTNVLVCRDNSSGIRVDFIFSFTDYERSAIKRAKKIKINGAKVNFASMEDVVIHKLFAARPRDIEDVEGILQKNIRKTDLGYIRKNLEGFSQLDGSSDILDNFEKILRGVTR